MIKQLFAMIGGVLGVGGAIALYGGLAIGWLWWVFIGVKLGSFMMVIVAILGPASVICSILGLWSLIFGIPLWLLHLVT